MQKKWMKSENGIFIDPAHSALVRQNLLELMQERGKTMASLVREWRTKGMQGLEYYRLRRLLDANAASRFRHEELETLAFLLDVDALRLLRNPQRLHAAGDLDIFEPVVKFRAGQDREKFAARAKLAAALRARLKESTRWPKQWPSPALTEAQLQAASRARKRGEEHGLALRAQFQAEILRNKWGLGTGPLPSISWLLLESGVLMADVLMKPVREGVTVVSGRLQPASTGKGSWDFQRFVGLTARFHELSREQKREQLAMQVGRLFLKDQTDGGENAERFARAFLLPLELKERINEQRSDASTLHRYAQAYGVRPGLLLRRCDEWGLCDNHWSEGQLERALATSSADDVWNERPALGL